jgi:TrmH family RNA methyltransferase
MTVITSLHNPAIKQLRALAEKKHRQALGLFLAEGDKMLARARQCGWEPEIVISIAAMADGGKVRQLTVSPDVMAKVSSQNNPPAAAAAFRQRWATHVPPVGLWLALEDIRDPGNLGTIIRTAEAAGAAGIILAGNSCDPWGPECVRATTGSIFAVPLVRMAASELVSLIRSWPGESVGTHLRAKADYRRTYMKPILIVMGSEGAGLSDAAAGACSTLVRIPMFAGPESLNVATAAALMLFEAQRDSLRI